MDMSLRKLRELVMDREAWSAAVQGVTNSYWTLLSDWTKLSKLNRNVRRKLWNKTAYLHARPGDHRFEQSWVGLYLITESSVFREEEPGFEMGVKFKF